MLNAILYWLNTGIPCIICTLWPVEESGGNFIISSHVTAKHPRQIDWHTYKERRLIENLFLKLTNNRRFATRYEKKALYFRAVTFIACILAWLL